MYNANGLQPVSGSACVTHMGGTEEGATGCAGRCCDDMMTKRWLTMILAATLIELPQCPLTWGTRGKAR